MKNEDGFDWMQQPEYKRKMKEAEGSAVVDAVCVCILALVFVVVSTGLLG